MQKDCAPPSGDPRPGVLVDLDDKVVEMVLARQPVTVISMIEADWPIVVPVRRIFAPPVNFCDGADRQEGARTWMTVGAPPQPNRTKCPTGRSTIAFAFVRLDSAAAKRDGYGCVVGCQPSAESVAS